MIRKAILMSFFLFAIMSCLSAQDIGYIRKYLGKYYLLNEKKLSDWRNDSTGCNRKRIGYLEGIFDNKMLIGMPKSLFLVFFGKPNLITKEGDFTYFVTIECDKNKKQIPDKDYYYLIVVFKDNKVELFVDRVT
ncbi:MAG: hypothetical protein ABIR78_02410 [Ferruginibacter sp.]